MNVLITGGASGLGEAVTRAIAKIPNHQVYFTFSNSEANARKIESEFSNAFAIKCDFRVKEDVNTLKGKIAELSIDVLINNAYTGEPVKSHFNKIDSEEFLKGFNDNIMPTVILTQAAINAFRKKKFGKIITVLTSFLVNVPPAGTAVYVANKAYLEELTKVWASENARFNITSNSVSPAFMQTSFTKDVDERLIEQMTEGHPLKALLKTEEVAEAIVYFLLASQQVNGANIVINAATAFH